MDERALQPQTGQGKPQKFVPFSLAITTPKYQEMINRALRDPKDQKRFISAITSAVAINPELQNCAPDTILSGALLGNSLGLSPSPQLGQFYLVPFDNKDRGCKVAVFQLGYKGYVQLALRSGYYKRLNVMAVKPGELKRYDPFLEEIDIELMDDELAREHAQSVGYVAMFEYNNGFRKVLYWSRQKMEAHALRYSPGYKKKSGYTFWEKDFDAMAFKTMLRQLISKWGIMSIELQNAFEQDSIIEAEAGDFLDAGTPELAPVTDRGNLEAIPEAVDAATGEVIEVPAPEPKRGRGRQKQPKQAAAPTPPPAPVVNEYTAYQGEEQLPFETGGLDDL